MEQQRHAEDVPAGECCTRQKSNSPGESVQGRYSKRLAGSCTVPGLAPLQTGRRGPASERNRALVVRLTRAGQARRHALRLLAAALACARCAAHHARCRTLPAVQAPLVETRHPAGREWVGQTGRQGACWGPGPAQRAPQRLPTASPRCSCRWRAQRPAPAASSVPPSCCCCPPSAGTQAPKLRPPHTVPAPGREGHHIWLPRVLLVVQGPADLFLSPALL